MPTTASCQADYKVACYQPGQIQQAYETEGVHGFPQIVTAEKYVLTHHLGDVISQSFSATERTFPSQAAVQALRGTYQLAAKDQVTVLAASGDSGAADVRLDTSTYYLTPRAAAACPTSR